MIQLLSSSVFSFPKVSVRKNEDAILSPIKVGNGFLMAIADGVGSYAGAGSASKSAIDYLQSLDATSFEGQTNIEQIFAQIKLSVSNLSVENPNFINAATTLTFCYAGMSGIKLVMLETAELISRRTISLYRSQKIIPNTRC
jgi:serine/threonine protein phosphatase PrpC